MGQVRLYCSNNNIGSASPFSCLSGVFPLSPHSLNHIIHVFSLLQERLIMFFSLRIAVSK